MRRFDDTDEQERWPVAFKQAEESREFSVFERCGARNWCGSPQYNCGVDPGVWAIQIKHRLIQWSELN